MIDLHTHTWYSDGRVSPEVLVAAAADRGLTALAITDHDGLRGSLEAMPYAGRAGLELVPAVEITTQWIGVSENVDILGYFVDPHNAALNDILAENLAALKSCIVAACEWLRLHGMRVTLDDVHRRNPHALSYLSVMHVLMEKGYAGGFDEADALFRRALSRAEPFGVRTEAAIVAIRGAGGVPVLAHPIYVRPGALLTASDLAPLIGAGLQGLECFHPRLTPADSAYYSALAQSLDLAVSGGSDEHGWPDGFPALGTQPVTEAMLDDLRARRVQRRT